MCVDVLQQLPESRLGIRIPPEQRQALARLYAERPDYPDYPDANQPRGVLMRLRQEARGSGYPWQDHETGLRLSRTVTVPVWGEHSGELRLDIDVGIGGAELVTEPVPFYTPVTSR